MREPEGQLARWLEKLCEHDFEIIYRPGRLHNNADSLSRQSCPCRLPGPAPAPGSVCHQAVQCDLGSVIGEGTLSPVGVEVQLDPTVVCPVGVAQEQILVAKTNEQALFCG